MAPNINKSKMEEFHIIASKNIIWGVSGLVLGLLINASVIYIYQINSRLNIY